jgi:hypothetical protein
MVPATPYKSPYGVVPNLLRCESSPPISLRLSESVLSEVTTCDIDSPIDPHAAVCKQIITCDRFGDASAFPRINSCEEPKSGPEDLSVNAMG